VHQTIGQTEGLQQLHRAAGDAVGLAHLERAVLAVDDYGPDVRKVGHLRRQHETGGTAPDDQDVRVLGQACRPLRDGRMRVLDEGVTRRVAVEIELHRPYPQ
jgi:hypothetical protein